MFHFRLFSPLFIIHYADGHYADFTFSLAIAPLSFRVSLSWPDAIGIDALSPAYYGIFADSF
jgi:hypothetical protein